ncbi:MAG: 16S rRNA (uracil(1498)-N(3))-methyltransferase [Bacteroidales bacterium]
MQIFYAPDITSKSCILSETESRHCIRVLRMSAGDPVKIVDGAGTLYEGFISDPDPLRCGITITGTIKDFEKRNYRLHIAVSPLKNYERFEWFVEKSVEIGIDMITPLICSRTEKAVIKADRTAKIIVSAMKQSVKAFRPILNSPFRFDEFISLSHSGVLMISHCSNKFSRDKIDAVCPKGKDAVILIGPEGDFSEEEIEKALEKGFRSVHLGRSRLRTETAGIAACHSVYFINQ